MQIKVNTHFAFGAFRIVEHLVMNINHNPLRRQIQFRILILKLK